MLTERQFWLNHGYFNSCYFRCLGRFLVYVVKVIDVQIFLFSKELTQKQRKINLVTLTLLMNIIVNKQLQSSTNIIFAKRSYAEFADKPALFKISLMVKMTRLFCHKCDILRLLNFYILFFNCHKKIYFTLHCFVNYYCHQQCQDTNGLKLISLNYFFHLSNQRLSFDFLKDFPYHNG